MVVASEYIAFAVVVRHFDVAAFATGNDGHPKFFNQGERAEQWALRRFGVQPEGKLEVVQVTVSIKEF